METLTIDLERAAEVREMLAQLHEWLTIDDSDAGDLAGVLNESGRAQVADQCRGVSDELRFLQLDEAADAFAELGAVVRAGSASILAELLRAEEALRVASPAPVAVHHAIETRVHRAPVADVDEAEFSPLQRRVLVEASLRGETVYRVRSRRFLSAAEREALLERLEQAVVVITVIGDGADGYLEVIAAWAETLEQELAEHVVVTPLETADLVRRYEARHGLFATLPSFEMRMDMRAFEQLWIWLHADLTSGADAQRTRVMLRRAFSLSLAKALAAVHFGAPVHIHGGSVEVFAPLARILTRTVEYLVEDVGEAIAIAAEDLGHELRLVLRSEGFRRQVADDTSDEARLREAGTFIETALGGTIVRSEARANGVVTITVPNYVGALSAYLTHTIDGAEVAIPAAVVMNVVPAAQVVLTRDATGTYFVRTVDGGLFALHASSAALESLPPDAAVVVLDLADSIAAFPCAGAVEETMIVLGEDETALVAASGRRVPLLRL